MHLFIKTVNSEHSQLFTVKEKKKLSLLLSGQL